MAYDFSGYATKNNIRCSDGRMIMPDAFKECDGQIVPLVWQHVHDSPDNVIGHAELENRPDGVYAYCYLNSTPAGETSKELIRHGDVCALSIYANRLKQVGQNVMHGVIREVSLVLAGANPGAMIDNLAIAHSDGSTEIVDDEACIYFVEMNENQNDLSHKESEDDLPEDPTIGDILDTMSDVQLQAVYTLLGLVAEDEESEEDNSDSDESKSSDSDSEKSDKEVKHSELDDEGAGKEANHSDKSDKKIEDILKTFDENQMKVVKAILDGVKSGKAVSKAIAEEFDSFSDEQKDAVYTLAASVMPNEDEEASSDKEAVKHSDSDTIQDILDTLTEEQKACVKVILEAVVGKKQSVSKDVADVFNTFTEDQKNAVYALVGIALSDEENEEEKEDDNEESVEHTSEEGENMKFNIFDAENEEGTVLSHDDMKAIFADAPRIGSLKDSVLQHGITDIEVLFPEAQAVSAQPYSLARRMEWVSVVLNGVHKSPFARIKSTAANMTEDQARARGYVKGRRKIEEQITALRRVTTPQTIYKLQKLDRDDVVDITDFDVVAWMKQEMRQMLDEELARAILVGDGRLSSDPEKIFQANIRSVWADDEMYTIHQVIAAANATDYTAIIDDIVRSRVGYKGSGNPVMFIGPSMLTELRLLKDNDDRFRYESDAKLAEALRVSKIHEVELFDDLTRSVSGKKRKLVAIILNLADYTVGANKGGEVSLFDDFDLDFNKMEYLIETRCSGALTMPKSAIAIEIQTTTDASADPVYTKVTSPVTADIEDYFEQDEYGRYFATEDSAVVTGKTYYVVAS
jgi:HK97 family phage major capsid protein